ARVNGVYYRLQGQRAAVDVPNGNGATRHDGPRSSRQRKLTQDLFYPAQSIIGVGVGPGQVDGQVGPGSLRGPVQTAVQYLLIVGSAVPSGSFTSRKRYPAGNGRTK